MTNNPTIDGVSRDDERHASVKALHDVMQSVPSASLYSLAEAVLDAGYAPAVEPISELREHCKQCAEVVKTWPEWKQNCLGAAPAVEAVAGHHPSCRAVDDYKPGDCSHGCAPMVERKTAKCGQCGSPSTDICNQNGCGFLESGNGEPEVAALQSTIAQLQAENSRVNDAWHDMKRELDLAKARVQELESGRGEPVMKLEAERLWGGDGEYAVSFVKSGWLDECRKTGGEFLLYTAPPAPVAVTLSDDQILDAMREHIYAADGGYVFDTAKPDVIAAGRALIAAALNNKPSTEVTP